MVTFGRETEGSLSDSIPIQSVVLKVASRCNLNCSYCYLYNHEDRATLTQPKLISREVLEALLDRMVAHTIKHGHRMAITFHGGEPTLLKLERFEQMVEMIKSRLRNSLRGLSIQTNATLLNSTWAEMFEQHDISVGVSLDGTAEVHDRVRVTHTSRGSHEATIRGIYTLRAAGIEPRILCVVNPGANGLETYRYFRSIGLNWIDFLLPDVSHDNKIERYGFAPHPVADYLIPVLEAWLEEDNASVMVPIFWNLLSRQMGGVHAGSDSFGNPPMNYVIVNTDGSIEPLDALKVCFEGATKTLFNVATHNFEDLTASPSLLSEAISGSIELGAICKKCHFNKICGGGYLPHRFKIGYGFENPSVWCADIQMLLDRISEYSTSGMLIARRSEVNHTSVVN